MSKTHHPKISSASAASPTSLLWFGCCCYSKIFLVLVPVAEEQTKQKQKRPSQDGKQQQQTKPVESGSQQWKKRPGSQGDYGE